MLATAWNLFAHDWRRPVPHPAPRPDYEKIDRLERELGISDKTQTEKPIRLEKVCLVKGCDGGTEVRTWSGRLALRLHAH